MKKLTISSLQIVIAYLLLGSALYAQVTTPSNFSASGTQFIGWNNMGTTAKHLDIRNQFGTAFNINFFTNGAPGIQRGTILGSNGFWGIGTPSPTERLTVAGNIKASGSIIATGLAVTGGDVASFDSIHVSNRIKVGNSIFIDGVNTANPNNIYTDAVAPFDLFIQSNSAFINNTIINANNTGNVGIGTTSPGAKLQVTATGGTNGIIATSVGGNGITSTVANGGNAIVGTAVTGIGGVFSSTSGFGLIVSSGNAGIGTGTPSQKLEVAHDDLNGGISLNRLSAITAKSEIKFSQNGVQKWAIGNDLGSNGSQNFFIWDQAAQATRFLIDLNGKVGIGITAPGCQMEIVAQQDINGLCVSTNHSASYGFNIRSTVNNNGTKAFSVFNTSSQQDEFVVYGDGFVFAREFKVTLGAFNHPDYVFADDYELMPIEDLEIYLKKYKHLPGIPSAEEVKKDNGIKLGEMAEKNLEKTEELYLYVLQLNQELKKLKDDNQSLQLQIDELKKK